MSRFHPTSSDKRNVQTNTLRRGDLVGRFECSSEHVRSPGIRVREEVYQDFPTTPSHPSPMVSEPHSRDDGGKLDVGGGLCSVLAGLQCGPKDVLGVSKGVLDDSPNSIFF